MTSLELQRAHLLHHVLSHAQGSPAALENTVLRAESVHMRQVLAYAASYGTLSLEELQEAVLAGRISPYSLHAEWLARLATVCALQDTTGQDTTAGIVDGTREVAVERSGNTDHGSGLAAAFHQDSASPDIPADRDTQFAVAALQLVSRQLPPGQMSRRMLKLESELLYETGRHRELSTLLEDRPELRLHYYGYLDVDSRSPFAFGGAGVSQRLTEQEWLERFNHQFVDRGLAPVQLRRGQEVPFNRLEAAERPTAVDDDGGPLVSVIMTTFKPVREDVLQSARSILAQSWQRLELLVIDDASPQEHTAVLDELEAMDERVRVTRLQANGGTYRARNIGLSRAQGELITGQDADDWSHPQRIEVQVRDMQKHPERPGNQVYTVNMTEDLVRIRRGYQPFIPSAPTLMVRSGILAKLGGYLPARKAADNELRGRVAAYAGRPVEALPEPLIFMRILPDSLSRADFRPGWQHPARRAFWSAYRTWHDHAAPEELRLDGTAESPVHVPARFTAPPERPVELDVVFAADWCEDGQLQAGMMEEIQALLRDGRRVGVLHVESALHPALRSRRFHRPVQELINAGKVRSVLPSEPFHRVGLMLVRSPELLEFLPKGRCAFNVDQVAVVAEERPVEAEGRVSFLPEECARHSEEFFGRHPVWVPSSPKVRRVLAGVPSILLSSVDAVTPLSTTSAPGRSGAAQRGASPRLRRAGRPVIGAWAGTFPVEWPARTEQIRSLLPADGSADVRLYGDVTLLLGLLGEQATPSAWMAVPARGSAAGRRAFLRSLDFFLSFPREGDPVLRRPVLEALAAGCVVILPPWMKPACGEAAIYATAEQVPEVVRRLAADPEQWAAQSRRAQAFRAGSGAQDFLGLMDHLAAGSAVPRVPQRQEMRSE